ncbi:MAG: hypothetical protein KAT05_15805 [Spirochaetes bacterium]|nr:hypothetical protein [Spirochaetota bacterium]
MEKELWVWNGRPLCFTKHSIREMYILSFSPIDIKESLNIGMKCPQSRRQKGKIEICTNYQGNRYKIVIADDISHWRNNPCWTVIHIKRFDWSKK